MPTKPGRLIVLALLTLLASAATAAGQTTRPAAPFTSPAPAAAVAPAQTSDDAAPAGDWPLVVRKFAETLCAEAGSVANVAALRPLVRSDCTVRRFDGGGMMLSDLTERTAGATLISARGYQSPVASMAGDIAEDAAACKGLSDEAKAALMPGDVEAMRRANATAARWIGSMLDVTAGQPVGVVVQWTTETPAEPGEANAAANAKSEGRLLIVLLKGQLGTDGKYRVRQIVYGNAKQATQ